MKTVKIMTNVPRPDGAGDDVSFIALTEFLVAQLFATTSGAFFGKWDAQRGEGIWFRCTTATAMFDDVTVDEVLYRDTMRVRFRSCIFRLGSIAADRDGDLCGVLRLLPDMPNVDPGPPRAYHVHASFEPKAGLWFKAAVVPIEGLR